MSHPPAVDLVHQKRFGHYEILDKLGAGGMGDVYRARDLTLGRPVAIKVLKGRASSDPERLARFQQEARSASALNHPNIVTIHEIGTVDGIRYIAMELVEGRTLRDILREGPLLTRRALQLAAQAAGGLAEAHAAGVVHRDLKPENIMVTADGRVKILDFGLAKARVGQTDYDAPTQAADLLYTEPGRILGTVGYMSPEQAAGRPMDFRSDQFSCGSILYEMATGRPPFRGPSPAQTMAAIIEDDAEPINRLNPEVPAPLRWIIERCLAKDPADRYGSTRDLARDLESVLVHLAEVSTGPRPPEWLQAVRGRRPASRRVVVGTLVALAVTAGVAFGIARWRGFGLGGLRAPAVPARRSVAVLGFRNLSGNAESAWLSTALAEMLTTELAAGGRLRTIPGENVGRMKMELSLVDTESLAKDTLARVGRNLGTDMVLLGSYVTLPEGQIRVDLRLQDVSAGETIASLAETGTAKSLIDLVTRAGTRLRQSLAVEPPPAAEVAGLAAGTPSNLDAQRLYAEGLSRLRLFDALAARDLLQKAVTADPNSPMARFALAEAWTTLGYDAHSREEARRAFDLSAHLPREERLSIEGRYRETAGQWDKAIEIYGLLLAFFPDNVEYGLRLASAQSTSGRGPEALATLARLRGLGPPAGEDPRIDLTEASVAQGVGDFRREQAAASQAAAKGNALGARLLVAQARLREAYALDRMGDVPKVAVAAEEARRIFAEAGDRAGLAHALNMIGSMSWHHGDLEATRKTWEECLSIRRQIGYRKGVWASLHNLGLVLWDQGELARARQNMEEGYAIGRELGDQPGMAIELIDVAGLLYDMGDLDGARKTGGQALTLSRGIGDRTEAAVASAGLAMVLQAEGDLAGAEKAYKEALPVLRERDARNSLADALFQMGELLQAQGDLPGARKAHEEALQLRTSPPAVFAMAKSQVALSRLAIEEGRPEAAEPLLRSALAVFSAQKAPDWEASAQEVLASCLLAERKLPEASGAIQRAAALAGPSQRPQVRLAVATTTARVHAANGRGADAAHVVEAALAEATKLRLFAVQLEIRLARGEIEAGGGPADGVKELEDLAGEARTRGFGLIARKAEARVSALSRGGAS